DPGNNSDPAANPAENAKRGRLPIFTIADPRPLHWSTDAGVWLFGNWTFTWYDEVIRVKSIDRNNGQITLAEPAFYSVKSGRFYAENLLEELDEPGEYYIDAANRRLYFWPPASMKNARIVISTLKSPLLSIDNAHDITFSGMVFENGRGDAIHAQDSTGVRIEQCTVRNVRNQGMRIEGGSDDVVDGCDIYDTGSGGMYISGGDRRTLTPGHQLVINNRIHDFARIERTGSDACAIVVAGVGNRVAHNLIFNSPFQAIWILGNDNIIEYNNIHDVVTDSEDAGAIYKGRDPSCRGNIIRYNFFHDIGMTASYGTCAVYFDDGDGGDAVIGNIFLHAGNPGKWGPPWGTVFSHGGYGIRAENNIFIDSKCALGSQPFTEAEWKTYLNGGGSFYWTQKLLKDVDITSQLYTMHYPALIGFMHPKPGMIRQSHASNNVFVRCGQISAGNWICDPKTMWSTNDDPGFVDASHGDFQLRPDAAVFKHLPDFKPIPFEKIGPENQ
ncbi:MAG TPA: right-handed parallel beta-helix repeat-containing protein, partial [Tepidisphaeraceae bacterium]|nr:right-handed parallel beta-helix repeat-containing protein [Tepidisphaeraceae bacterium]